MSVCTYMRVNIYLSLHLWVCVHMNVGIYILKHAYVLVPGIGCIPFSRKTSHEKICKKIENMDLRKYSRYKVGI